jgi:hypothetical protein
MTEEMLAKVFEEKQAPCPKTIKLFPLKCEYMNFYVQCTFFTVYVFRVSLVAELMAAGCA